MDSSKIKKVHYYINLMNDDYDPISNSEKKAYYKLIKPFSKYKNVLHLLPKKDINLILKDKFDYEKNKIRINKILEKHNKKVEKRKNHYIEKQKKSCKRYYGNKAARKKEEQLLTKLDKKSRKYKQLIFARELHKQNCKN